LKTRYPSLANPLKCPCKAAIFLSQSRAYFSVFRCLKNSTARVGSLRRRLLSLDVRLFLGGGVVAQNPHFFQSFMSFHKNRFSLLLLLVNPASSALLLVTK
jgi:hypothetical protein